MLFIRSINYLIGYIEQHLGKRLGVESSKVEEALVDKLKIKLEPVVQSLPPVSQIHGNPTKSKSIDQSALSSGQTTDLQQSQQPKVPTPLPPLPSSNHAKNQENVENVKEKSESPVIPQKSDNLSPSQEGLQASDNSGVEAPKTAIISEQVVEGVVTGMSQLSLQGKERAPALTLPVLPSKTQVLRDFKEETVTKLDDVKLRLLGRSGPLTWGALVNSSEEDFKTHLKNELKNEETTDKKMYILARFMRQLQVLSERAKEDLVVKEKATIKDEESVDAHLLSLVQIAIQENLRLSKEVLEDGETSFTIASWLPKLTFKSKPCKTEAILLTCQEVLNNFFEFCQSVNIQRKLTSIRTPGSMIDVFPGTMRTNSTLTVIDQRTADYVIENLLSEAEYHAHQKLRLRLPKRLASYDEEVGKTKRKTLMPSLLSFNDIAAHYSEDSDIFWEKTLSQTDDLRNLLLSQTPYMAYYFGKSQRSTDFCEQLHTVLVASADTMAPTVARKHKDCNKLK